jgi:hypothetical protein
VTIGSGIWLVPGSVLAATGGDVGVALTVRLAVQALAGLGIVVAGLPAYWLLSRRSDSARPGTTR